MTERARYWAAQVAAWERSGLTQAEFCRRRKIKAVSFGWWKRKLQGTGEKSRHRVNRDARRPRTRREADFVEVALPGHVLAATPIHSTSSTAPRTWITSPMGPYRYEIALSSGRVIRLPQDFDPGVVSQLIAVVESC